MGSMLVYSSTVLNTPLRIFQTFAGGFQGGKKMRIRAVFVRNTRKLYVTVRPINLTISK